MAKNFIPVNLPASTVKKIKKLKIAYSFTSGRIPSYEDMFDMLIESVEKSKRPSISCEPTQSHIHLFAHRAFGPGGRPHSLGPSGHQDIALPSRRMRATP